MRLDADTLLKDLQTAMEAVNRSPDLLQRLNDANDTDAAIKAEQILSALGNLTNTLFDPVDGPLA
ncbi:hypothetical protein KC959_02965 [Candidatus Saccharibacteria bacterium]|nr:hypothetical protein [Candidatus Saccharibacteria bacterium]